MGTQKNGPRPATPNSARNGPLPLPQERNLANKRAVRAALDRIAGCAPAGLGAALASAHAPGAAWRFSHPLDEVGSLAELESRVWAPLKHALPDLERRDEIVVGGAYRQRDGREVELVACLGHYLGSFRRDWLGIPATGQPLWLRYGEVHRVEDERIVHSSCLWDVLDAMRQAGYWPLAPSYGTEVLWQGPITSGGIVDTPQDMDEGLASIRQTLAMHATLAAYDDRTMAGREGLIAMPQREHWHERMMWYGPAGIGTNRGLSGFVDFHQLPFRLAFPGRRGGQSLAEMSERPDAGHYIQIGDGPYSVTGGWPSVIAVHSGGDLFGSGPTGRTVEMRVMDFYLHHEGRIRENWVPLDVPHLLLQMGIDVFGRMERQFGRARLGLPDG